MPSAVFSNVTDVLEDDLYNDATTSHDDPGRVI
jgi:hypothetical protein